MTDQIAHIASLRVEIDINALASDVWKGLTQDISQWWPADFYSGGSTTTQSMEIELIPGGRMFETWGSGGGTLWGTVVSFEPGKTLQIVGHQFPDWGGPSEWYGTWALEPFQGRTRLTYSEATLGQISNEGLEAKDAGWKFLCACLKAFIEEEPAPEWPI